MICWYAPTLYINNVNPMPLMSVAYGALYKIAPKYREREERARVNKIGRTLIIAPSGGHYHTIRFAGRI
jgi:hypothetical protein